MNSIILRSTLAFAVPETKTIEKQDGLEAGFNLSSVMSLNATHFCRYAMQS